MNASQELLEIGYRQIANSPYYCKYNYAADFSIENFDLIYSDNENEPYQLELGYLEKLIPRLERNKGAIDFIKMIDYIPGLNAVCFCGSIIDHTGFVIGEPHYSFSVIRNEKNMASAKVYFHVLRLDNGVRKESDNVAILTKKADGSVYYSVLFPPCECNIQHQCLFPEDWFRNRMIKYKYNSQHYHKEKLTKEDLATRYIFDVKTRHMYCVSNRSSYFSYVIKSALRRLRTVISPSITNISTDLREYRNLGVDDFGGSWKRLLSYRIRCKIRSWKWNLRCALIINPIIKIRHYYRIVFCRKEIALRERAYDIAWQTGKDADDVYASLKRKSS